MATLEARLAALEAQRAGPTKIVVVWTHDGKRYTDWTCTVEAPDPEPGALVFNVRYDDDDQHPT